MGRPNRIDLKREELLPIVARAFGDLGYHRATTAEIARRCRVRENILYRLWEDKKAMYIASIRHVFSLAARVWSEKAAGPGGKFSIDAVLEHEAVHLGEFGNHRLLFAGLSETEDRDIRRAVREVYLDFHDFIRRRLAERRRGKGGRPPLDPSAAAWAIIGLGTACTIGRELDLLAPEERGKILKGGAKLVIGG